MPRRRQATAISDDGETINIDAESNQSLDDNPHGTRPIPYIPSTLYYIIKSLLTMLNLQGQLIVLGNRLHDQSNLWILSIGDSQLLKILLIFSRLRWRDKSVSA